MSYSQVLSRVVSIIGVLLYSAILYLTFSVPDWLESFAASYIESEVSSRIDLAIDRIEPTSREGLLGDLARKAFEANQAKIDEVKVSLRNKAHETMARAIAEMRDLDCDCRAKFAARIKEGFEFKLSFLQIANDKIMDTIQGGYVKVVTELRRDIRIFAGSNIAVFLLLLLTTFLKPAARLHVAVPASLLTASTLICSYFYIIEQNWFLTIIHSDYLGFAYLGYLGFVAMFLADILFNHGRVTTQVLNAMFEAFGSALFASPC